MNVGTIEGILRLKDEFTEVVKRAEVVLKDLSADLKSVAPAAAAAQAAMKATGSAASTMGKEVSTATKVASTSYREVSLAAQAMVNTVAPGAARAVYAIRQIPPALKGLDPAMKSILMVGSTLSLGITLPLAIVAKATAKTAADFETSMTRIETLVGVARAEVEKWKESVRGMVSEVGQGPTQLAEGLYYVTGAGIRTAKALDIVRDAAKASAIGLGDMGTISRTVVGALQAWEKQGLDSRSATETLVATVREGNLVASEVAGSFGRVMSVAATMGVTFDEVGAYVATFSRQGVSAAEAVTSLRGVLSLLMKGSRGSAKALEEVGLSAEKLRGVIKGQGLMAALMLLYDSFEKAGKIEDLGKAIPNIRALAGVLATVGTNGEAYVDVLQRMKAYHGDLDETFKRVTETANYQWGMLTATITALAERMGSSLLPAVNMVASALTSVVGSITQVVKWLQQLPAPIGTFAQIATGVFAVSGPFLVGIAVTAKLVRTVRAELILLSQTEFANQLIAQFLVLRGAMAGLTVSKLSTVAVTAWGKAVDAVLTGVVIATNSAVRSAAWASLVGWFTKLGSVVQVVAGYIPGLTRVLTLLSNPFVAIATAIGVLTYGFLKWAGALDAAKGAVAGLFDWIMALGENAFLKLKLKIAEARAEVRGWIDVLLEANPALRDAYTLYQVYGNNLRDNVQVELAKLHGSLDASTDSLNKQNAELEKTIELYNRLGQSMGPATKKPPALAIPEPIEVGGPSAKISELIGNWEGSTRQLGIAIQRTFAQMLGAGEQIGRFDWAFYELVKGSENVDRLGAAFSAVNQELKDWKEESGPGEVGRLAAATEQMSTMGWTVDTLSKEFRLSAQAISLFKKELEDAKKAAKGGVGGAVEDLRKKVATLSGLGDLAKVQGPQGFLDFVKNYKSQILDVGKKAATAGVEVSETFRTAFDAASGSIILTQQEIKKLNDGMLRFGTLGRIAFDTGAIDNFVKRFDDQIVSLGQEVLGLGQPMSEDFRRVFERAIDAKVLKDQLKQATEEAAEDLKNRQDLFKEAAGIALGGLNEAAKSATDRLRSQLDRGIADINRKRETILAAIQLSGIKITPANFAAFNAEYDQAIAQLKLDHHLALQEMQEDWLTWGNVAKRTLASVPEMFASAFTGGGGIAGAMKGISTQLFSGIGKLLMSGPTGFGQKAAQGLVNAFGLGIGGALAEVLPGIGALLGPLVASLGGKIFGWLTGADAKKAKKELNDFIEQSGGLDALKKSAAEAGISLTALLSAKSSKKVEAEIKKIQAALEAAKKKAEEFKTSLTKLAESGGLMGAAMQEAFKTIKGEGIDEAKWQFLQQMADKIATGFNKIAENVWAAFPADLLAPFTDALSGLGDTAGEVVKKFYLITSIGRTGWQEITESVGGTSAAFGDLAKTMIDGIKAGKPFGEIIADIAKAGKGTLKDLEAALIAAGRSPEAVTNLLTKISDRLKTIGPLAGAAFGAMLSNGKSVVEAMAALEPGLASIETTLRASGLQAEGFLGEMMGWRSIVSGNKEMFTMLSGVDDMLVGLHNSALLTQESFSSLATLVGDAFSTLQSQGVGADEALRLMAPQLQKLWELSTDFGYSVDETTQKMLDQAKASGLVGDEFRSSQDKMVKALETMTDRLTQIVKLLGGSIPEAADQAARGIDAALNKPYTIKYSFQADGDVPTFPDGGETPGYASGTKGFVDFGRETAVRLHGREAVFTPSTLESLLTKVAAQSGSVAASEGAVTGGMGGQPLQIEVPVTLDGYEIARIVATKLPQVLKQRGVM